MSVIFVLCFRPVDADNLLSEGLICVNSADGTNVVLIYWCENAATLNKLKYCWNVADHLNHADVYTVSIFREISIKD